MEKHKPDLYVAGVWVEAKQQWLGNFHATAQELMDYSEKEVFNLEEFDLIVRMVITQESYNTWWEDCKWQNQRSS